MAPLDRPDGRGPWPPGRKPGPLGADPGPLTLAYIGDAVYTLFVRTHLAGLGPAKPRELHRLAAEEVRAAAQARTLAGLEDQLTEEEKSVVRWARNAKIGRGGGGTTAERHLATGFEALLGHLYLTGQDRRLEAILGQAVEPITQRGGNPSASGPASAHP